MKRLALLLALGGCDAVFGLDTPKLHDGGGSDGSGSADCSTKVGSYGKNGNAGWFQYCPVSGVVTFSGTTVINTDNFGMCAGHETFACLIEGGTITLNGVVTVSGMRPLILAASTEIDINGILDVSSSQAANGPGADPQACPPAGIGGTGTDGVGGGGGAGGSWSSSGGNGGLGGTGPFTNAAGIAVGTSNPPTMLRGGCAGGAGGAGSGGGGGGRGGPGGGAVYLTSPQIVLDAASLIESVGMFGTGGVSGGASTPSGGGGGGGTGGLIVFDTATLMLPTAGGLVFANGGGAGAGGDPSSNGMAGMRSIGPTMEGSGGKSSASNGGGVGGAGALGTATAGTGGGSMDVDAGGGGGGGGEGFILLFSMKNGPNPTDVRYSPPFVVE